MASTAKLYELRIRYSQNGLEISDELFREVPFFWTKADEYDAQEYAKMLVNEYGCGMAEVYHVQNNCITYLSTHYARLA